MSLPGAAFVVYALRMYFLRYHSLCHKRPNHFEDKEGTLAICVLISIMAGAHVGASHRQKP